MMQMEILRLQVTKLACALLGWMSHIISQALQQVQGAQFGGLPRRASQGFAPPATAGPLSTSFDVRSAAASAQAQ